MKIKTHLFSAKFLNMDVANTSGKFQVLRNEEWIEQCSFGLSGNAED